MDDSPAQKKLLDLAASMPRHLDRDGYAYRLCQELQQADPGFARQRAFEEGFDRLLAQLPAVPAPERLRVELRFRFSRRRWNPGRFRQSLRPLTWAGSGALAAALVIFFLLPGTPSEAFQGELSGTIVCMGCNLQPETQSEHAAHRNLEHRNGFRCTQGKLWNLLNAQSDAPDLPIDDAFLGQRVRIEGLIDPQSRSIVLRALHTEVAQAPPAPANLVTF